MELPQIPAGSGAHPVSLVSISSGAAEFYTNLFGWKLTSVGEGWSLAATPAGPQVVLDSATPDDFPTAVPFIEVPSIAATLEQVTNARGEVEREPWSVESIGELARFRDPAGTLYGLRTSATKTEHPHLPIPLGPNPRPAAGAICSLEMYVRDAAKASSFFGEIFEWGTTETMPSYLAFDPGAGIGGVFQSHTPSAPAMAYIAASDVPKKIEEIEAAGGERCGDPMEMPGMAWFGYFKDAAGTTLGLMG